MRVLSISSRIFRRMVAALSVLAVSALTIAPAQATDVFMLPIDRAMAMQDAGTRLDGTVKFYFGDTIHPAVLHDFGRFVSNRKTDGFAKSDMSACAWAFLSALLEFQKRAHALGANAVIDIHSYYKKEDVSNNMEIPCYKGFIVAGLAIRGDFVTIADH
jgi:uncharacterized protein YbjQ (UPF0145 family)